MSTEARSKSILPAARDSAQWNPMQDGITRLYRHMKPGEKFAGMSVTVIDGQATYRLVLERDGMVRRLTIAEDVAGEVGAA